jgi:hypothetical protein
MSRSNVVAFNTAKKALKEYLEQRLDVVRQTRGVDVPPATISSPPGVIGYSAAVLVAPPTTYDVAFRVTMYGPKLDAPLYRDGQLIASQGMADPALTTHYSAVVRVKGGVVGAIRLDPIGGAGAQSASLAGVM